MREGKFPTKSKIVSIESEIVSAESEIVTMKSGTVESGSVSE
jgi:hypothetical protein